MLKKLAVASRALDHAGFHLEADTIDGVLSRYAQYSDIDSDDEYPRYKRDGDYDISDPEFSSWLEQNNSEAHQLLNDHLSEARRKGKGQLNLGHRIPSHSGGSIGVTNTKFPSKLALLMQMSEARARKNREGFESTVSAPGDYEGAYYGGETPGSRRRIRFDDITPGSSGAIKGFDRDLLDPIEQALSSGDYGHMDPGFASKLQGKDPDVQRGYAARQFYPEGLEDINPYTNA